ncbi:MAG: UDP-2,3-diacylglucosamine diphosphatase [gamma proteobacterium symbiont of Phacoides pectinatus]
MADTLLISDLHLSGERPATVALFLRFLEERARGAGALYVLGDLFDAWIGDDATPPPIPGIMRALRRLNDTGTPIFLQHGNRDFLLGDAFARATGCTLLDDPVRVELGATTTLLMHGDLLCTDDHAYQQTQKFLRSPGFISDLLSKTIEQRLELAAEYRRRSGEATAALEAQVMDVNQQTVERYMREAGVRQLIHGHTHRPGVHRFTLDGEPAVRRVLAQWSESHGQYLRISHQKTISETFPKNR